MRDSATDVLNLFPEFEENGAVDSKSPIRIKKGPDCDRPKLMLQKDLYNSMWAGRLLFAEDVVGSMSIWGTPIIPLPEHIVPDATIGVKIAMLKMTIKSIAVAMLLMECAISVGKFAYEHIGFGEGFGMCFGGGTIARE